MANLFNEGGHGGKGADDVNQNPGEKVGDNNSINLLNLHEKGSERTSGSDQVTNKQADVSSVGDASDNAESSVIGENPARDAELTNQVLASTRAGDYMKAHRDNPDMKEHVDQVADAAAFHIERAGGNATLAKLKNKMLSGGRAGDYIKEHNLT